MKRSIKQYNKLSLLALIILVLLVIIQVSWLRKAILLQKEETHQKLQRLVPEMALSINSIDHDLFHGEEINPNLFPLGLIRHKLDSILSLNELSTATSFALLQGTKDSTRIFVSDAPAYKSAFLASNVKACMTCIVAFSILSEGTERSPDESEEEFRKRIITKSTHRYFSPVNSLEQPEDTLWLVLYQPNELAEAFRSLIYLFIASILLLFVLLYLFYILLKSLSEHKQLIQVKDDFFNNMTHEFKTPLSSIRLASRVLRQSEDMEKNKIYHQLIEKESKLLENQVDKLLELSLLESKGLQLEQMAIPLHELLLEIPRRLNFLIKERKATLNFDLKLEDDVIYGDFDHLLSSFSNLVENSLKYSKDKVNITISTEKQEKRKVISFKDNGPGIATEYQDQIFDRFFRAQKNNQYKGQGFGIGLSYVKNIIEAHKGAIKLNKNYTKGCEFIIEL